MSSLPFQPSCPQGGVFYVCSGSKSKFVGCCGADPCSSSNGCSAGNLRPASFNATAYGTFADQECSAGSFFTCSGSKPPFLGCCKSNPCSQGSCPVADLAGAFLSGDPAKAASFLGTSSLSSSSSSTLATKQSSSKNPTDATSAPVVTDHHEPAISTGAIVGIAIAAFFIILGLTAALMYLCGRRHATKSVDTGRRRGAFEPVPQEDSLAMVAPAHAGGGMDGRKLPYSPYLDSVPSPAMTQHPYFCPPHSAYTQATSPPLSSYPNSRHTSTLVDSRPVLAELDALGASPVAELGPGSPTEAGVVPQVRRPGRKDSRDEWDGEQGRTSGYVAFSPGSTYDER